MKTIFFPRTVVRLENVDAGISNSIVRLSNSMIDAKRIDRKCFFRREPLLIRNPDNGSSIIRFGMGSNGLKGLTKDAIALDYDATDALGVTFKSEVNLEVKRASRRQVYLWFYNHPDLLVQISSRLAMFGAVMGLMGLGISVLPILVSFI